MRLEKLLVPCAGLIGAGGVAAAAAASHGGSESNLGSVAMIFLAHGPALLAIGLYGRSRWLVAAGLMLAAGTLLFGADLLVRDLFDRSLFPGAAPIGGAAMILGWLGIAVAGLVPTNRH
jgi:uncharacterized membrane protein YgdD (TMEM256/DUF423 family)